MRMCKCVFVGGQRTTSGVIPQVPSTSFFKDRFLICFKLAFKARVADQKASPRNPFVSASPVLYPKLSFKKINVDYGDEI